MTSCEAISYASPFCNNNNNTEGSFASNTTRRGDVLRVSFLKRGNKGQKLRLNPNSQGDAFGTELAESGRFSSSGLSLAFEELLLGGEPSSKCEGHLK
jgi:hypothetical protein